MNARQDNPPDFASPALSIAGSQSRALPITVIANLTIAVIGVATGLLAARILGPKGEGELAAIQTWPLLFATVAMLGLPEAIVYHISRDCRRGKQYVATGVLVGLLSFTVVALLGWSVLPPLLAAQPAAVIDAARVFLIVGILYAILGIPNQSLRGADRYVAWNLYRIAPGMGWLMLLLISAATFHFDPVLLSRWFLVEVTAAGLPFLLVVNRSLHGSWKPEYDLSRRLVRFGLPTVLTTVPQLVSLRLDQLLIIAFLPSQSLGFYVVAVAWSGATAPLLSAVGQVLFPRVARQPDQRLQAQMLATALRGSGLVAAITSVGLASVTPWILTFAYGAKFAPSVPSALVLIPASAILAWAGIAEEGLRGLGRPSSILVAEGMGAIVTILALPGLLMLDGILGAAVASLLGYTAVAVTASLLISRQTTYSVRSLLIPTCGDAKHLFLRIARLMPITRAKS